MTPDHPDHPDGPDAGGGPAHVYLVRGEDAALVDQAVSSLLARLVGDLDPRLVLEERIVEANQSESPGSGALAATIDACTTAPFLAGRRVVVLREVGRLDAVGAGQLASCLARVLDSTQLVLVSGGGALAAKVLSSVRHAGEVIEAGAPQGRDRSAWVNKRVKDSQVSLDAAASSLVERHLGSELGRLSGLLETLAAAHGPGARLGREDVAPYLGEAGGSMPWDLTDALDRSDAAAALVALSRLVGPGQRHPLVVLASLHRHYGAMLALDGTGASTDGEAATILEVRSAWSAGRSLRAAQHLGGERIGRAISLLSEADLAIKGASALPGITVLEILVARLARLAPAPRQGPRGR